MNKDQAEKVCDILTSGFYEATIREEYSGRGMYGETCLGIVYDGSPVKFGAACVESGVEYRDLPTRQDSMGKYSQIYY